MPSIEKEKTLAESMVHNLEKISSAVDDLKKSGLPETIVMSYVKQKTHLPQRDIRLVFDALKDMNKELKR